MHAHIYYIRELFCITQRHILFQQPFYFVYLSNNYIITPPLSPPYFSIHNHN